MTSVSFLCCLYFITFASRKEVECLWVLTPERSAAGQRFTLCFREKAAAPLHPQPLNSSANISQPKPQRPQNHPRPPARSSTRGPFSYGCHREVTGGWMASSVQYRVSARFKAFSPLFQLFGFTQQEWVVVVEEGGGGGVLLLPPPPPQSHSDFTLFTLQPSSLSPVR